MAEDRQECELTPASTCEWIRAIDSNGKSIKISKVDLLQGMFTRQSVFEGNADELTTAGMYYVNGKTQNVQNSCGLFVVLRFDQSITQFSFNVFDGAFFYRTLLYNNGKWDTWTTWRRI